MTPRSYDTSKKIFLIEGLQELRTGQILASGCFDVFHSGHVQYLEAAASLLPGAALVVGINDDESVTQLNYGSPA